MEELFKDWKFLVFIGTQLFLGGGFFWMGNLMWKILQKHEDKIEDHGDRLMKIETEHDLIHSGVMAVKGCAK
ncbi:MAG: hypothetical protein ABFD60_07005 [Bryobacteraceae bacterium]